MILSADTNLFLYAANPAAPQHAAARRFFATANVAHFKEFGFEKLWSPV